MQTSLGLFATSAVPLYLANVRNTNRSVSGNLLNNLQISFGREPHVCNAIIAILFSSLNSLLLFFPNFRTWSWRFEPTTDSRNLKVSFCRELGRQVPLFRSVTTCAAYNFSLRQHQFITEPTAKPYLRGNRFGSTVCTKASGRKMGVEYRLNALWTILNCIPGSSMHLSSNNPHRHLRICKLTALQPNACSPWSEPCPTTVGT